MASIQNVLNEQFLERIVALQKGETRRGAALNSALSGQRADTVTTSIRAGSRMYAKALTGINFGISFLNFARSDLQQVGKLTEKLTAVVEEAASRRGSRNDRLQAQRSIREIGNQVQDILQGAKVGDREYLTGKGIEEVFEAIGLGPSTSRTNKAVFEQFVSLDSDQSLIDPDIKGRDSFIPRELGKANPKQATASLFDGSRALTKTADAYAFLDDLRAFSDQITTNLQVIDHLTEIASENALLTRSTAIAFLEIGDAIGSAPKATEVVRSLQRSILKDARAALSQAENLDPILAATLTYSKNGIVVDDEG
ncbi:hypothetical protein MRY87_02980 [bacterium]|nr:hypothetical protein [bacterium]